MRWLLIFILLSSLVCAEMAREGETLELNGYEVTVEIISDRQGTVLFTVDGIPTKALHERESHEFPDGTRIFVGDIITDEAGDQRDIVKFYFRGDYKEEDIDIYELDSFKYDLPSVEELELRVEYPMAFVSEPVFEDPFEDILSFLYGLLEQ